jgi:membrane protease YdiL (CAAX protease family)
MRALIALAAALLICGLVVLVGPGLAEAIASPDESDVQGSYALLESVAAGVIFGPLLLVALLGGALTDVHPLKLGRRPIRMAAFGAGVGLLGLFAAISYAAIAATMQFQPGLPIDPGLLLWGSAVVLFMAVVEEVFFRGWLQPVLTAQFGLAAGIVVAALAFAALHLMGGARSPTTLLNLVLGGLLFGLLAARGGGIAAAAGAHASWNWGERILAGLDPNPGVGAFGAIRNYDIVGPLLWGGSDEGLNASLAMTMALAALLAALIVLVRAQSGTALDAAPGSHVDRTRLA